MLETFLLVLIFYMLVFGRWAKCLIFLNYWFQPQNEYFFGYIMRLWWVNEKENE
uniref:Uncharacterized protein n=1 Tax=Anopheles quadriannulatus TaxID=34691 RepID=A0A182XU40_ANOQN